VAGEGGEATTRRGLVRGSAYDCAYLDDLTTIRATKDIPYTNPVDWGGLHAKDTDNPVGVPGLQVDGYFLDDASTTTRAPSNFFGNEKYRFDSQFVIRFPNDWNGKLVITGAPGVRGQYANDFLIGDYVLDKGYAFASTDKGNSGLQFYRADETPGAAVAEWHQRISQLTEAAKDAVEEYYGDEPVRTYITGTSNGGYLTRYALERHPELYDGGVDWQGLLWLPEGPNLLMSLPPAVKYFPEFRDLKSRAARDAIIRAGFAPESDFLWQYHYEVYWNSTQRSYREEFDPYWLGSDADYDYAERLDLQKNQFAQSIKIAVERVSLTGDIGKHLITLHGTLDALLPAKTNSDKYAELIEKAGRSDLHRYYKVEGGNHVDGLYDYDGPDPKNHDLELRQKFREKLRPMLPCYRAAFEALEKWVEKGIDPPRSQTVPKPEDGDVVNCCPPLSEYETPPGGAPA
jgi:pimeloyl-ACP methyl ester carboxylesterase